MEKTKEESINKREANTLFYQTLGRNIKEARKYIGYSQEELAETIGISRVSMNNIETGKQRLPIHVINDICSILKTSIADIVPSREAPVEHRKVKLSPLMQARAQEHHDQLHILALQDEITSLKAENERLRELVHESILQIEHMHRKYQETGSGNNLLLRLNDALNPTKD